MAALHSLLPEHRTEVEADLVKARMDRDAYTTRLRQLWFSGGDRVHRQKLEYQIGVLERWISRYERQLGGGV